MDELKKHIQQRLNEMDVDEPSDRSWDHIQGQLFAPKSKVIQLPVRWAVAACIVLLAGIGLFLFTQNSTQKDIVESTKIENKAGGKDDINTKPTSKANIDSTTDRQVAKEMAKATPKEKNKKILHEAKNYLVKNTRPLNTPEDIKALENVENSFTQVINMEKTRINTTPLTAEDPGFFNDFGRQIAMMESDEAAVKKEIKKHGITDGLLDRLINIYQQKLNVLKQLQKEMQKTNNRYKQCKSTEEMPKLYFLNI